MALGRIDKSLDRSAFQQIADEPRQAIQSGDFGPGTALPSEARLMEHFGVARMTVRQALQVLKAEDLVVAEHGRGVFVRQRPPVRRLAADRFARVNREQGKAAFTAETEAESRVGSVDRVKVSIEPPSAEIRARLQLTGRDRVVVRDRRYLSDGRPVETAVSYLPASIARGTKIAEPDTGPRRYLRPARRARPPVEPLHRGDRRAHADTARGRGARAAAWRAGHPPVPGRVRHQRASGRGVRHGDGQRCVRPGLRLPRPLDPTRRRLDALAAPGLHFHDLRHTGNMLAAASKVSTRDLTARMGHDSIAAALIYQHGSREADRAIADHFQQQLDVTFNRPDNDDDGPEGPAVMDR